MKIPLSERAFLGHNSKLVIGRPCKNPLLRRKVPPIPSSAHWGWGHLPVSAKILFVGILCGLISITTPFWASVTTDKFGQATYGLWHFCRGDDCTSIHDNILEGTSVPGWFFCCYGCICARFITAQSSYASAVLGIVILFVCLSVRHTHALWRNETKYCRY